MTDRITRTLTCRDCGRSFTVRYRPWTWAPPNSIVEAPVPCPYCESPNAVELTGTLEAVVPESGPDGP